MPRGVIGRLRPRFSADESASELGSTAAAASASARLTSRWVTMRTAVGPTGETRTPAVARRGDEPGGVVAGHHHDVRLDGRRVEAARLGEQPRVGVVVGETLDVVVERVQPGGGQDAHLAHPATHPLAPDPRLGDRLGDADHQRPDRAPRAPWTGTPTARPRRRRTPRAGRRWRRGRSTAGRRPGGPRCRPSRRRSRSAREVRRAGARRRRRSCGCSPPTPRRCARRTGPCRARTSPRSRVWSIWPRGWRQVRIVSPVRAP